MKTAQKLSIIPPGDDTGAMLTVHPDNLHDVWPEVREGLIKVQEQGADGWIPEDVWLALKQGFSSLHIMDDHNGFVVLTPGKDFRGQRVHVWCAYYVGGDGVKKYLPKIKAMAKEIGAYRITFESCRKGWEKVATPVFTQYEVRL